MPEMPYLRDIDGRFPRDNFDSARHGIAND